MKRYICNKSFLFFFVILVLCNGCKENNTKVISIKYKIQKDTLVCDTLCRISDSYSPQICAISKEYAALFFDKDGSSIRVWDQKKKELRSYNIRKKTDTVQIADDSELSSHFELLNKANNIYYQFVVKNGNLYLENYTRLRLGAFTPREACRLGDKIFVGLGNFPDKLLALYNRKKSKEVNFYGNYPIKEHEYTYGAPFLSYYEGKLASEGNKIVYVAYRFGYIACYLYKDEDIIKLWDKKLTEFLYEGKPSRLLFSPEHQLGFTDVKIVNDRIYALYNGNPLSDLEKYPNTLLVYNSEGEQLASYVIHEELSDIAIDNTGTYLYSVYSPYLYESYLIRYKLPVLKNN